ncbi:hypothetical protein B0F90DRAFT_1814447 [Multifurca ochricompacta]|uniref:Uncharacterized protein n=1 Tax=Multifurca ochricompacta TaxID=376703 RepID=A0AAD4MA06_9AGAM|nr:hypothetical protein B0F90DRAFT_1814447 [Multifurca ochricompacta]
MSLVIKIPKKSTTNSAASEPSNLRRKSNRRRVTTDSEEDDYEPSPPHSETKPKRKFAPKVKNSAENEDTSIQDEHKPNLARARDRNQPGGSKRPRDDVLSAADEPEEEADVVLAPDAEAPTNPSTTTIATSEAVKEESTPVPLPPFKKRRLPPIKKNKSGTVPPSNGTLTHLALGKSGSKPPEVKGGPGLVQKDKDTVDALSALKRPKRVNNQQEVNLNDKSVYESLFKQSGGSTPRAGLNLKEKEERRGELDRMREEDRARRAVDAERVFDLRTQHDKITSFVERLQARRSGALWPNILAVAFRQEREKDERRRERERTKQGEVSTKGNEIGEVPEA